MGELAAFLKEQSERLRASEPDRTAKLMEWKESVRRLMAQLEEWVREADPQQLIAIDESLSQRLAESKLGVYYTSRLSLQLGAQQIWVIPKARNVLAVLNVAGREVRADGLVIITDYPPLGDQIPAAVYNLFRVLEPDGERWYLRYTTSKEVELLSRERFEHVLVTMLQ
ncbi:MAG TPA: hypothetical protein VH092_35395 [Urbifossiella sp.]|jgi:hypothetical protein|nr:hypothetical protein [Urbifossiella sp.]